MAILVAGGVAMGSAATSAAVSGGMSLVSEASGKVNTDAKRLADLIAERSENFYKERGWL